MHLKKGILPPLDNKFHNIHKHTKSAHTTESHRLQLCEQSSGSNETNFCVCQAVEQLK